MTLDVTTKELPDPPVSKPSGTEAVGPALVLEDLHGMEVGGSVPVWALAGLRLHKSGWRQLESGCVVGVYVMDISAILQSQDSTSDSAFAS